MLYRQREIDVRRGRTEERRGIRERTGYYERDGVAYLVHFPTPYERAWGFGCAKLGEPVAVGEGQLVPLEVWSRYRSLCAGGEPFDIALEYRGMRADPSVVLALGRLASGEWDRFALCLPSAWVPSATERFVPAALSDLSVSRWS